MHGEEAYIQVYEETGALKSGEPVRSRGSRWPWSWGRGLSAHI